MTLRRCLEPGCRELTARARCPMHERSFQRRRDASRPNATQRGYGWDWQKVSRQVRREEPVCHWCRREPSQVADHVIPVSRGGTSDRENLVGACFGCNRRRASRA